MTIDITKLEVLAKAASQGRWNQDGFEVQNDDINNYRVARCNWLADAKFIAAASPVEVLALIATGKQQAQQFKEWQASHHANYVAVAEERDQLRAEVAGLRTGYEAYERVNAEMKAEVEGLRKDVDRASYWKQRAKSAEGHLFSGDFRAAAMELHKYSRFESTPWPELTGSQHALISSAAGAVIATVNRLRDARRPKNRDETDAIIWCACGDGHAANSYGAGFMDANKGVCANCDAAMGKGDRP